MSSLVLGPLLRHVDDVSATIWVETRRAATVTVVAGDHRASARTFAVHDHHYALVAIEGLAPGTHTPYTVLVDDEQVWPEPDSPYPPSVIPTLRRQAAADGVRLVPGERAARPGRDRRVRRGRAACLRAPHGRRRRRQVARPRALPRRPGLRRRDQRRDAGVHRLPAQPRGAAGGGAQGLRGVRPPLRHRLVRPGEPMAAVDAAQRDDLRRPRHPRRLEHQLDVAPGDGVDVVVARPDRRRAGVVLGLPAPRQPQPRRPGRG